MMDPCQLSVALGAVASCLAKNLSDDELDLLAAILTQLGDTLATIAIQRSRCRPATQESGTAPMLHAGVIRLPPV